MEFGEPVDVADSLVSNVSERDIAGHSDLLPQPFSGRLHSATLRLVEYVLLHPHHNTRLDNPGGCWAGVGRISVTAPYDVRSMLTLPLLAEYKEPYSDASAAKFVVPSEIVPDAVASRKVPLKWPFTICPGDW